MKIEGSAYHYGSGFTVDGANEQKSRKPLGFSQYSGTVCQQSGQWRTLWNTVPQVVSIEKGTVMPYHAAQAVQWTLTEYSPSETRIVKTSLE
ncbi:MAG: hypothetical protein ACRDD5_15965 [Silvania sp.]|uniref:hypothetical protein n=1 Tax=Silvania sp. TaxID=3016633 RepID=UPI003EE80506